MVILYDDVECSKENFQPMASGRTEDSLANCSGAVAAPHASQHPRALQFEQEITTYTGPDPLQPWLRYIHWTQSEFVSGGDRSHLTILLERCCMTFKDDERYRNSKKYLKVWIIFADNCHEGVEELFQFLRTKQIGQSLALFYQGWAMIHSDKKDFVGAEEILELGIANAASPLDRLVNALDHLRAQAARETPTLQQQGNSRSALLQLPKAVDVHRERGTLPDAMFASSQRSSDCPIEIYTDENGAPKPHPARPTSSFSSSFSNQALNKENVQQPSTWVKPMRMKSAPAPAPIQVFVDESLQQDERKARREVHLRKRLNGAPVAERLRLAPLTRMEAAPTTTAPPPAEDYARSYDVSLLLQDETEVDGLCFEEVRARDYALRSADDTPMTVNYSQILQLQGPGLKTPNSKESVSPTPSNPRRLQFIKTPGANVVDVTSNQTPLSIESNLIVDRNELMPPTPTATMTVNTREALEEVRSMFCDESSSYDVPDHVSDKSDEAFDIYHDPTVELGPTVDPHSVEERHRLMGDVSQLNMAAIIDHTTVSAPDEIDKIELNSTVELDDADLMVVGRMADNVFEGRNISGTFSGYVMKIARPPSAWESFIAERVRARFPSSDAVCLADRSYIFDDVAVITSALRQDDLGTVETLIREHRRKGTLCPEPVAMLYTQNLLTILQQLSNAQVIHCAIHPRHLVLGAECKSIALIDFSLAVDVSMYTGETRFLSERASPSTGPWRHEIDALGAASTIHQLLFGTELDFGANVQKMLQTIESNLPESYELDLWANVFRSLLTEQVPSPALQHLISQHWGDVGPEILANALSDTYVLMSDEAK